MEDVKGWVKGDGIKAFWNPEPRQPREACGRVALTASGRFLWSHDEDGDGNTYQVLSVCNVPGTELNAAQFHLIPFNSQGNSERWVPSLFLIL